MFNVDLVICLFIFAALALRSSGDVYRKASLRSFTPCTLHLSPFTFHPLPLVLFDKFYV